MRLSLTLWVVVDSLATYRLTRLITRDRILERPRRWVRNRSVAAFDFVTCPWCVSVWLAGGVVFVTWAAEVPWSYVACGLTFTAVTGVISELVG